MKTKEPRGEKKKETARKIKKQNSPGGPEAKHLPAKAGDTGLIPRWETKIPRVAGQRSPEPQLLRPHTRVRARQQEREATRARSPCTKSREQPLLTVTGEHPLTATKTPGSQK